MKKIHLIYGLILMLASNSLFAQLDVKNTAIVYVGSATDTFFVSGSFTNASGSAFTNNGIFQVKKDLINDQAGMTTGTGTLYLNGSSAQIVSGSHTFKTYNFFSNNAAGITLNNNLSVSGAHTYTAGMIITSATPNYMIYESGSSYSGSGDTRHVNGWVKKIGNTNFIFPVGNATYERTVALTNLTAVSEFNVRHNLTTPNRTQVLSPIVLVDTAEYWTINKISGSAARVTMNWDNSKVPFPMLTVSGIRAAYFNGSYWTNVGGTGTGSTTLGSVTSNSITAFNNNFVVGSTAWVLPLKIISFTGGRVNDHVKINWVIGNELNVDHYELERSDDGINFYAIAVQAPFNRNNTELYSYDDHKALKGIAYYRLKIDHSSNQLSYSNIITISVTNNGKDFYVITNPVDAAIDIFAGVSFTGVYNYTIVNNAGQIVQSGVLDIRTSGVHTIKFQSMLSSGTYFLSVRNAEHILQKTILKK